MKAGKSKKPVQGTLNRLFAKANLNKPKEFSREGVLHAVAQFVACDDQVQCEGSSVKG